MNTISITDFALHLQTYLDKAMQGEKINIQLANEQIVSLIAEPATKKTYTKADLLKKLSYRGNENDSLNIDSLIY